MLPMAGIASISVAAFFGCLRFGGIYRKYMIDVHDFLSLLGSVFGFPLIAAGCFLVGGWNLTAFTLNRSLLLYFLLCGYGCFSYKEKAKTAGTILSIFAGVTMVVKGVVLSVQYGMSLAVVFILCGVVCAVVAGEFIKGIRRNTLYLPFCFGVDVFHYLFAVALILIVQGIIAADSMNPNASYI